MQSDEKKTRVLRTRDKGSRPAEELDEELWVKEIEGVSDRSAAILVASQVDEVLGGLIESNLEKKSEATLRALYGSGGALSTFYAKIHLGYAMGFYDEETRDDLEVIRRVRNVFAHAHRPIDFKATKVAKECRKFKIINDQNHPMAKTLDWTSYRNPGNLDRDSFVMTALSLSIYFAATSVRLLNKELKELKRLKMVLSSRGSGVSSAGGGRNRRR